MTEKSKLKYKELFPESSPEIPTPDPLRNIGQIENVETEARIRFFKQFSKIQIYGFSGISLAWIIFWANTMVQKLLHDSANKDLRGYFFVLIIPFILFFIVYANFKSKILKIFIEQFAKENGFIYLAAKKNITDEKGALFNLGHGQILTHVIGGKLNNHDVKIFYYNYTIGHGKQARTYFSTVLRITNNHIVPPILLVVDKQYFGGISPNFTDSVKIKPEMNFDAQFDLYTKKKYEIEALQVFKPEFMEIMLKRWQIFNIDFTGNEIYIFTNKHVQVRLTLQNMFALGKYILEKIDPQLERMQGSILNLHELNPNNK